MADVQAESSAATTGTVLHRLHVSYDPVTPPQPRPTQRGAQDSATPHALAKEENVEQCGFV